MRAAGWGIAKEDVERGMVLPRGVRSRRTPVQGGSLHSYQGEGGRHTPFFKGYRRSFICGRRSDGSSRVAGGDGDGDFAGADNVQLVIELISRVAMEKGLRFAIREVGIRWAPEPSARLCK